MTIEKALMLAVERCILSLSPVCFRQVGDTLEYGGNAPHGWDILAGWLSAILGITVWAGKDGITAVSGDTVYLRIISESLWYNTDQARILAEEITGEVMPQSLGAIARKLWDRLGARQWADPEQLKLIKAPGGFYVKSLPGKYATLHQYDLSNAYGSIIARLPSPYVKAYPDGSLGFRRKNINMVAWAQLQECSRRNKHLGRILYGTALGSSSRQRRWYHGDKMMHRLAPGPWQPMGFLTARLIWELSYLASQGNNAVHAYTDCVTIQSEQDTGVQLWDLAGAQYKLKACGSGDIINACCYRVGEFSTEVYKAATGQPTSKLYTPSKKEISEVLVPGDAGVPQLFSGLLYKK